MFETELKYFEAGLKEKENVFVSLKNCVFKQNLKKFNMLHCSAICCILVVIGK
jgi:hypothetical protein